MNFSTLNHYFSFIRRNVTNSFGLIVIGIMLGSIVLNMTNFPMKWFGGILAGFAILFIVVMSGNVRSSFIFFLILSIPLGFNFHLTYREGHIGISDGFTIELIDIFLIVLLLVWAYDVKYKKQYNIDYFPKTTLPILFMLLSGLLSFWNSSDYSLSTYGIFSGIKGLILYFYLANNINTKHDMKIVVTSLQLCFFILGVICIVEAVIGINFTSAFKVLEEDPYSGTEVFRSAGLHTPTYTGGYLASMLPLIFVQFFVFRSNVKKILLFITLIFGMTGLVLTLTRSAWFCLAIGSTLMVFFLFRYKYIKIRPVVLSLLLIVLLFVFFQDKIMSRLAEGSNNLIARVNLLHTAINMVKDHPVSGIGLNTYILKMDDYTHSKLAYEWIYIVHNKYLLVWSETGTLGLISFFWLFFVILTCSIRLSRSLDPNLSIIAIGLFSSLVVMGFHMHFESYGVMTLFWFYSGIIVGMSKLKHI